MTDSASNASLRGVTATLLLASTMTAISTSAIAPALPAIRTYFTALNTPNVTLLVELVVSITALCTGLASPLAGMIADRLGRRPLLLGSLGLTVVAGSAGAVLDSLWVIVLSRALLGVAVAGVVVAATTLLTDYFTGDRRETVLGWQGAIVFFAGGVFLPISGMLADISWRFAFLVYLAPSVLFVLGFILIDEPTSTDRKPAEGHNQPVAETGIEALTAPKISERLTQVPLARVATIFTTMFLAQIIYFLLPVRGPFYLQTVAAVSATWIGVALAGTLLISGVVALAFDRVSHRLGVVGVVALHFGVMSVGYAIVALAGTYVGIAFGLAVTGVGLGLQLPAFNTWTAASVPDALRGRALGGLTSVLFVGQFASPLVTRPLVVQFGLRWTFGAASVTMVGLALVLGGLRSRLDPSASEGPKVNPSELQPVDVDSTPSATEETSTHSQSRKRRLFESILIATDGSLSDAAIETALHFAANSEARVHVLYVVDTRSELGHWDIVVERRERAGEQAVEAVAARGEEFDVGVIKAFRYGTPHEATLAYAADHKIDLIVTESDRRTGLGRLVGEDVPGKIYRHASRPVLTVRPRYQG